LAAFAAISVLVALLTGIGTAAGGSLGVGVLQVGFALFWCWIALGAWRRADRSRKASQVTSA
jgi:hypothetical protein